MPIEFHRDGPWELPKGWVWARAGDVLPLEYGKGLPERDRDGSGQVPVYGSAGIVGTHSSSLVDEPCLIVARKGSVGAVFEEVRPSWPIDTVYFARESPAVERRYAYWFIFFASLDRLDQSTAVPSLSRDKYDDVMFPVPPNPEQRRIADRIDDLFTQIADGETLLARARDGGDTWRRSLLKGAVTGELTREWREGNTIQESASDLLMRIENERKKLSESSRSRSLVETPIDTSELPILPETWAWARAGQICGFITKGTTPGRLDFCAPEDGIPFIKVYNLTTNGELDFTIKPSFVRHEIHRRFLARSIVKPRDVLMNIVGPPLGKVSIVP